MSLGKLVSAFAVLLVAAGAAIWFVRRFGAGRLAGLAGATGEPSMKLLSRLPLGGRRGLVLVRVADRMLVLGISEAGIQKVLDRPESGEDDEFARALREATGDPT
jgi:flagellar biosynthetic protein FliO